MRLELSGHEGCGRAGARFSSSCGGVCLAGLEAEREREVARSWSLGQGHASGEVGCQGRPS